MSEGQIFRVAVDAMGGDHAPEETVADPVNEEVPVDENAADEVLTEDVTPDAPEEAPPTDDTPPVEFEDESEEPPKSEDEGRE